MRYSHHVFCARPCKRQCRDTVEYYLEKIQSLMQNNLYVSSLAWATTDDSLRAYFATIGEVKSAMVIKDKMSGRSRGFGFVEMATAEAAADAVAKLNETDLDGRNIRVAIAEPREERPRREFNN